MTLASPSYRCLFFPYWLPVVVAKEEILAVRLPVFICAGLSAALNLNTTNHARDNLAILFINVINQT